MGSCFSSSNSTSAAAAATNHHPPPTAKVINIDGSLIEFSQPIKASLLLGLDQSSRFLCNADGIFYGQFIQAMRSDRLLEPGQLYFVLPAAKLEHRLTVAEMVSLAVTASSAFAAVASARTARRRRAAVEVMPIIEKMDFDCYMRISDEFCVGSWKLGWDVKKSVLF